MEADEVSALSDIEMDRRPATQGVPVSDLGFWEAFAMKGPDDPVVPAEGEHYREMASGLRKLARQCRFAGARRELLHLAANYERRADHFDDRAW